MGVIMTRISDAWVGVYVQDGLEARERESVKIPIHSCAVNVFKAV